MRDSNQNTERRVGNEERLTETALTIDAWEEVNEGEGGFPKNNF